MDMIKAAICDDEPNTRAYLSSLIRRQPYPCEIAEYASAGECLAGCEEADLLFLDIELGGSGGLPEGMELARKIRAQGGAKQPAIIFVTGYEQYVFDAFDVGAFQYLLKPVDEGKFAEVFARAAGQALAGRAAPQKGRMLALQSGGLTRSIPLDSIYYIESSNHKVVLHMEGGTFACYAKIRDLEGELQGRFFRIHKGYLANLSYVAGYSKSEVSLSNGETLLLSKYKYRDFVSAYLRFLKGGGAHE